MRSRSIFLAVIALLSGAVSKAHSESLGHIPQVPVRLGGGFNLITPEKVFPACIIADRECQTGIRDGIVCVSPKSHGKPLPEQEFAPSASFSIREIRSKYDYFKELNITASVSGSYGIFSGSASFSYHSIDDIDEELISWSITAKSLYGSYALAEPKVAPLYEKLPGAKLVDTCGPQYVAEVDRGVMASVLYTFHSKSEQKLREFSARLSAGLNAGVWNVGGTGTYHQFMTEMQQYGQISIKVFTIGGEGSSALSELVTAKMTDLDVIKTILAAYVKNQKTPSSAILGFRTSSIGKLVGKPEIDPDFSSYLYFLDRINQYRVRLQDLGRRLDKLLLNPLDFSRTRAANQDVQKELSCELEYINARAATCRLWTDTLVGKLANGTGADDAEAKALMTHSSFVARPPGGSCDANLTATRASFVNMNMLTKGKKPFSTMPSDESPCAFEINYGLMARLSSLPRYPFDIAYAFDAFGGVPAFPASSGEALYLKLDDAAQVAFVEVRDVDQHLLSYEANQGAASFGFATKLDPSLRGQPVSIQVNTKTGGLYELRVEVPKLR